MSLEVTVQGTQFTAESVSANVTRTSGDEEFSGHDQTVDSVAGVRTGVTRHVLHSNTELLEGGQLGLPTEVGLWQSQGQRYPVLLVHVTFHSSAMSVTE